MIEVLAKDVMAILTVLDRIQDVRVPELVNLVGHGGDFIHAVDEAQFQEPLVPHLSSIG